jgi:hypothetical protein
MRHLTNTPAYVVKLLMKNGLTQNVGSSFLPASVATMIRRVYLFTPKKQGTEVIQLTLTIF